jgi:hypothetical protein
VPALRPRDLLTTPPARRTAHPARRTGHRRPGE